PADRIVAPAVARPEVAPEKGGEIVEILAPERLVEAEDALQILHRRRIERPLEIERSAGRGPHQDEGDGDDGEQRRRNEQESLENHPFHGASSPPRFARRTRPFGRARRGEDGAVLVALLVN